MRAFTQRAFSKHYPPIHLSIQQALLFTSELLFKTNYPPSRSLVAARQSKAIFFPRPLQSVYARLEKKKENEESLSTCWCSKNLSSLAGSNLQTRLKLTLSVPARWVSPTRLVALHGFSSVRLQLSRPERKSESVGEISHFRSLFFKVNERKKNQVGGIG